MCAFKKSLALVPMVLMGQVAFAEPSESANKACEDIRAKLPNRLYTSPTLNYAEESNAYWSTLLHDLKPACIVLPESAEEVSIAIKVLNGYPDVKFTAKSGGHNPNPGYATVEDGVLISLTKIRGATYDKTKDVCYVKPGGEWNDVISELDKEGVAVAGGRLGGVGVAGLLLQGGMSFLSSQVGLAADNIVGWEVVTGNGTIVNVDAATQPDLAVAMRGSGSQFGIVTKFTIKAHHIGDVWGGQRIYDYNKAERLFKALHEFIPHNNNEEKAAIIVSNLFLIGDTPSFLVFYFYEGEEPPTKGPFADFLAIDPLIDTTKKQKYPDLLKANGAAIGLFNARQIFRTFTIPYSANRPGIYQEISDKMNDLSSTYLTNVLHPAIQCSIDFQPLASIIGKHTDENGGNAMGLTGSDPDRIILEIQCSWFSAGDDTAIEGVTRGLTSWLEQMVPIWEDGNTYMPLLMNDATEDQNVTGSYRDYAKLKSLQLEHDPDGTLRDRTGGFKY